MKIVFFLFLSLILSSNFSIAQQAYSLENFNRKYWKIPDSTVVEQKKHMGKDAVFIKKAWRQKGKKPGFVYFSDIEFTNGTIECDLAAQDFVGLGFRVQNNEVGENIYFRPSNSGTERHDNTIQYILRGTKYTWKYLREKFPGKYESGVDIKKKEWFHVKLVVKDNTVKVFVNYDEKASMVVTDMKLGIKKGYVGLWTWNGYFANLVITPED